MTMEILEIARREYNEAKEFYETEQRGLGSQFEKQIRHSLLRIQQYPQAWPPERKEIRRYLVHKFPYNKERKGNLEPKSFLGLSDRG